MPAVTEKAGMRAIRVHMHPEAGSLVAACYRITKELRAEINGLWAAQSGSVSARPGKRETERREQKIEGLKWALALAMGFPLGEWRWRVDAFMEDFREEVMTGRKETK